MSQSTFMKKQIQVLLILLISVSALLFSHQVEAQGIKGNVKSSDGEPLAFASVYIRNLGDGVPTNEEGNYEYKLPKGVYDVLVQYLGYKSQLETITVSDGWTIKDFVLDPQEYTLAEVEVRAGAEDPALTIMRKAIAKAKYHRLQIQKYSMTVYLKGTGKLTDAPFFLRKTIEKEGLKLNEAYTSESVSRITFTQPNKVEEKVISIRTNGDNQSTSPAPYIQTTFYQEKINGIISPLSRSAFQYYKFHYEGSFFDQNVMVSKIKVTPRSRGEQVFEGFIYIIEDLWAIHSLNLQTSMLGFQIQAKQQYAPVADNVWMPLTHTYDFGGKIFGFEGNFKYLASTREYEIELNPDLAVVPEIIDEKVQEVPEDAVAFNKSVSALEQLAKEEPKTRKEYRKLLNEYEKESLKELEEPDVVQESYYEVDSMAKKYDQAYWDSIRPVPLTESEIEGYQRDDSLATVEVAKMSDVDSVAQKAKRKMKPLDFMNGASYSMGKGVSIGFKQNWTKTSFNTVEGFKVGVGLFYRKQSSTKLADSVSTHRKSFNIEPELRYGFSSNRFYGKVDFRWSSTLPISGTTFGVRGGRYIYQFNGGEPINEQVNALYSLLLRQNYMKLYEQDFAQAYWAHRVNGGITYRVNMTYAHRAELFNTNNYSFYNKEGREYTSNQPENVETSPGSFGDHDILKLNTELEWRPGIKYGIRNGRKYAINDRSPLVKLAYNKAFGGVSGDGTAADFDHLELGIQHNYTFGVSGKLDFNLSAGAFLSNDQVYFPDFQHFGGNRTIFSNFGPASNYRFMDYYKYSTNSKYFSGIVHYQFRKFLFTQLPMLRFSGLRENIFFNYLKTDNSPHYWEVGYSLDNLFRIFRLEMGAGFENNNFLRGGVRFGVATFINVNIDN
ncbi:CarboxypepD_reg-like domain-containing protein [Algoriphagus aquimarinus]|uniref:CarboxypepD_reg-like domain-containing protein n=2 Tax=Algoriphagus aquimarinus TaxID=237018 RepID=A0A1I0WG29_9BACT|nr:CarboxypepD_reg-like domain-containing protein [Algoriphagus aquimarinus]